MATDLNARSQWPIENRLHFVRYTTFAEDASKIPHRPRLSAAPGHTDQRPQPTHHNHQAGAQEDKSKW
ncbi:hypothetical protein ACIG0C_36845 [Kitasatospora aureofaciens]|uniref:Uncharacterized protein n=1 Tax=Kitasatospora aureofaciens TaxID=1894 RepID=A0A8H9I1E5_KITAU|nr:hypothetical protein [Kitasatospora aureofaciens]GGV09059.1 hypothetical protein GCM10010502_74640 [Kitasatospora aureofaciens]